MLINNPDKRDLKIVFSPVTHVLVFIVAEGSSKSDDFNRNIPGKHMKNKTTTKFVLKVFSLSLLKFTVSFQSLFNLISPLSILKKGTDDR